MKLWRLVSIICGCGLVSVSFGMGRGDTSFTDHYEATAYQDYGITDSGDLWTGVHAGLNAGYGWGRDRGGTACVNPSGQINAPNCQVLPNGANSNARATGFVGGGQIGIDKELDMCNVLGIEADIDFCLNVDVATAIPVLDGNRLVRLRH